MGSKAEFSPEDNFNIKSNFIEEYSGKKLSETNDMETHFLGMEDLFSNLSKAGQNRGESMMVAMILRTLPEVDYTLATALESREDENLQLELDKGKLIDEANKQKRDHTK